MLFEGSIPATEPVVMGHEGVGFAEEIGAGVKGFNKGDRLGFLYIKDVCCECRAVRWAGCSLLTG